MQQPLEKTMSQPSSQDVNQRRGSSRRQFITGALSATAAAPLLCAAASLAVESPTPEVAPITPERKIKIGLVGCGGRGGWISEFFQQHGGYEFHAVADYFQDRATSRGNALGVPEERCFSGLSGYKKVIESGIEAIVLQTPPCFFPEHAKAAVEAGLHVYVAKPVAVDVPGCLTIEAAGKLATEKKRVFLVDYQLPTEPANIEVAEHIRKGEMGKPTKVITNTIGGFHNDKPKSATIEDRLHSNFWGNDIALGGGTINYFDIHMIDAVIWILGYRPVAAIGEARICAENRYGDNPDVYSMLFDYGDGPLHTHGGLVLPTGATGEMKTTIYGQTGYAIVNYEGEVRFQVRGEKPFTAKVADLYPNGAKRNVAAFYQDICEERFDNPTVRRAVDGCLTCILGREAGLRHGRLTMEELLKENKRLEIDLTGLKA
jgi:myo-inositol 2-dehydrogenase/D-chiro-inositol 1-dehydrogenase